MPCLPPLGQMYRDPIRAVAASPPGRGGGEGGLFREATGLVLIFSVRHRESGDPARRCPEDKAWVPASAGTNGETGFRGRRRMGDGLAKFHLRI